jgi:hypothetical protein
VRFAHVGTSALVALLLCRGLQAQSGETTKSGSTATVNVYDGFEMPALSKWWEQSRFEFGAVSMETQVVRAGHQAIAITVRSNDKFEAGQHGSADSERDELLEARMLAARQDSSYEQSFSMFFPQDFPIVPTRLVIAQWKQYCGSENTPCSDDSPVLALRYIDGTLLITQDLDKKYIVLYQKKTEFRGRWLDFKTRTRFSPNENGRVKVWLDNKLVVDHTGITADAETTETGYANPTRFYFKMGLYRNVMKEPMTVYIDEYRKREIHDEEF